MFIDPDDYMWEDDDFDFGPIDPKEEITDSDDDLTPEELEELELWSGPMYPEDFMDWDYFDTDLGVSDDNWALGTLDVET